MFPMIVSSSLRSVPLQKMLVPESSVLSSVVVVVIQSKYQDGGDVQPVILEELQGKEEQ